MKVSFRCQNCKKELRYISIGDDGTVPCPFCKTENKLKKVDVVCPNCKNITESWIPEGTQVWGVHYADLISPSMREAMEKKSSEFQNDIDRDIFLIASFKNGGEVESKCSNCETYIHTYFKKGDGVGDYRHILEIIGEYIPKKLGKPRHLFGLIPDKDFQSIMPLFLLFIIGGIINYITPQLNILFGTNAVSPKFSYISFMPGFIIFGLLFTSSYYFFKKIKDLAGEIETKLKDDKKQIFRKTFSTVFKSSWLLLYFFIIFVVLSIDNLGPHTRIKWLTDVAGIPIYLLGAAAFQVFAGYGILLYVLGGGPQFDTAFKGNFFEVRNILRRFSSINFMISLTVSILSTMSVITLFYFSPSTYIETYTLKGLLILWISLLMLVIITSFIGYSLLLQNITFKISQIR